MADEKIKDNVLELVHVLDTELEIPQTGDPQVASSEPKEAKIWAYLGVAGGVGTTSIAVQTAYELAALCNKSVCLIDLDFESGSCAAFLDMPPSLNIAELNAGAGRMDIDLAATFINEYQKGFSVIAAGGELGGNDLINPAAMLALLDAVCQMYDVIVLDIPSMWRACTQAAIGASDKLALVTEMRVPALHKTKKLAAAISGKMSLDTPPDIILGKYERRSLRHAVDLKDAQKVLKRKDLIQICVDEDSVRSAINCGQPAGKLNSDSRYVKSVRAHINSWLGVKQKIEAEPIKLFQRRAKRA